MHLSRALTSIFCFFIMAVIISSCAGKKEDEDDGASKAGSENGEKQGSQDKAPPQVVVTKASKQAVPIYSEWVGQTDASQTVNIRARVDGILETASFQEGDYVKQGQVLYQIERDTYKAALQSAKAELEKAKAALAQAQQQVQTKEEKAQLNKYESALTRATQDLARTKALADQGAISQHDLDVAVDAQKQAKAQVDAQKAILSDAGLNQKSSIQTEQASVEAAQAAVTQAELNLKYTTITSPLFGIIGKRLVSPGNLVSKADNTTLATISAVDPIKVDFNVSEAEYLRFAKKYAKTGKTEDHPLELYLADNTQYPLKGKFNWVDRAVDSKTGTISVEALFPNPKAIIRPGQFARVRSLVEMHPDAIVIPDKCVQDLQGSKIVYIVGPDKKVEQKSVTLGPKFKDRVVVEYGLKDGDSVIVEGLQKARPGEPVELVKESSGS